MGLVLPNLGKKTEIDRDIANTYHCVNSVSSKKSNFGPILADSA